MKVDVYDLKNEIVGTAELPERVFGARWNPDLVNQARLVFRANQAEPISHAKGRGEVRGGGRKPWRQKGTGRSRQGSIRSPLWKGGGVSHGPVKIKNSNRKLNKKMRQGAIFSIFSKKFKDGQIKVVDTFTGGEEKTKVMASALRVILGAKPNALLVGSDQSRTIKRIISNIPHLGAIGPRSINVYDLLRYDTIVIEKPAIEILNAHFTA